MMGRVNRQGTKTGGGVTQVGGGSGSTHIG